LVDDDRIIRMRARFHVVRIAVSGTHCSGKSTLIADFLRANREFVHEPEPYEWLQEVYGEAFADRPTVDDFYRQLEVSVERLRSYPSDVSVIVERSPIDFVAYILAIGDLGRERSAVAVHDRAIEMARRGTDLLDRIAFLPLPGAGGIIAPDSEDLELREAANARLIELFVEDEFDLLGERVQVVEIRGTPTERLRALQACI